MNANDIIEKCARVCDRMVTEYAAHGLHTAANVSRNNAEQIRALKSSLPAENEVTLAAQDAALGGTAFMQDGKRIDPAEVYSLPAETVSEEMVKTVEKALQKAGKKWIDAQEFPEDFSWADVPDEVFARAALETVALAHADDGWRPIESTPRIPGKPIDLWVVPGTPLFGERGKPYREADARLSGNGKHWLDRQGYYIEGRRYRDCDGEYFNETDRSPDATIVTHYRIPAPPKDGRE